MISSEYTLKELKIEVNRECPLRCLHCSSNGTPYAPEKLDESRVADLITEFAYMGGEKLCISGGEPLCYEGLPAILHISRTYGIETQLYTVGISSGDGLLRPISERILSLLAEYQVKVIFSLHGMRARTHDVFGIIKGDHFKEKRQ